MIHLINRESIQTSESINVDSKKIRSRKEKK